MTQNKPQIPDGLLIIQPLLLQNTILVPHEFVDGKVFRELSWAIAWIKRTFDESEERRIVLRFLGPGGETPDMFATIDLLHAEAQDGTRIEGYLYGGSYSAHSIVWAACPYRYTLPHGYIGVHSAARWDSVAVGGKDMVNALETVQRNNRLIAQIYSDACDNAAYDSTYWEDFLNEHPHYTAHIDADQLVNEYLMCELYDPRAIQEETEE